MFIKESQLRNIIRNSIRKSLMEQKTNDDEDDIVDTWNKPDEFDDDEAEGPSEDDIEFDTEEKPENLTKTQERRKRAAELIRSILSKRYSGDKLEREVEKRLDGRATSDSERIRPQSYYTHHADNIRYNNMNLGAIDSGVGYNDDDELFENKKRKKAMIKESRLNRIIKESIKKVLKEGNQWIGQYNQSNYNYLIQKAEQLGGSCSFSLNGCDFTMTPTQRGFAVTSGTNQVADTFNIEGALKQAWQYSNKCRQNNRLQESYDREGFSKGEIMKLVSILKQNPIEEMWKPYDLGWCKVQRVEANQTSGRASLLSNPRDINGPQDLYSKGVNGEIFLQIGRTPNTNWYDESGYTYMCWK